ncbi:progestin and adipoQ receptor family member 3 isoform X3 [Pipistrellus kuhlii]|uniref:progestin and adipoQ receptor family member 3 isoform X3 n=1 Tax=Pipistrellus kuhlii TaxID=59472 RepID=UPI00174F02AE|nr:progestin and adipoQ receptor family member 3 isoform X3 [Pipistrellus kuhlii]
MHQKLLKSAHYIELGSYQYWPVLVPRGIRLYTYEQIPVSLKDNPYITDGYRAYLPSRLCIKSLFILSNETVNIWSHLLGFFLFFTLGIYDMTSVLPSASASREDFVICSICLFCFQVCMLCSVGYHLFSCHRSEKTCRRWMALDYAGISIGILGCYVSGVFYAFYCNNDFAPRVVVMYVIALLAFLFYISKVPERYFPEPGMKSQGISVTPYDSHLDKVTDFKAVIDWHRAVPVGQGLTPRVSHKSLLFGRKRSSTKWV